MSHFFKKSAPFLFILFTFTTVFAQDDFRRWQPEDGVAVRQGWHVEWNRSGISRTEGELAGEVGFVWSDCRNGYRDVYMQVISTDGEFKFDENGLRITSNQSHQEDPVIYPSSDGGWFISWWESFAIGYRDSINLYCTKINSEGERIWAIDEWIGVPVCVGQNIVHLGEGFSILCQIQEDNDGGCILVWQNQHIYEADIYAMHVNSEGELDENWEENGISVVAENGSQTQLDAISDGEGGMIIVWKDGRDDRDYNIWAQRITSNSELLWGNGIGVIVCSNDENQEKPKLCSDGANGAFIVWVDERNWNETHRDIYAQRINTDGELLWSEEGDAVCTVEREQSAVLIAASGEAEAIICWEDKRNERETTDIYSMLINGNDEMVKEWEPESGVPVVIADRYQNHVRICSDSEGGAYFVWEDERDGSFPEVDIDAQRINGEGSNVWEENGIPICTDVGAQLGPAICQTENSFTMAWADWSSGSFDLKIQRVSGEGEFVWEENRLLLVDGFDGFAQYPKLLSRGDGEFVLVWSDGRLGSRMYPFVQYCRDNGNEVEMLLQKDGQQVFSGTDGGCYYVEATLSDDGSVFAVWKDLRNEQAFSIYAQKLSEAGELQWGESGIRISEESIYEKNRPKICTDANGGIYVVWESDTEAEYDNLFMQHVDGDGNLLWNENIQITNHEIHDVVISIIPDGDGGAVLVWVAVNDETDEDIWAARINSDGEHLWGDDDNDLIICNARLKQFDPQLVRHQNGYMVVWTDGRDDENDQPQNDIFGQFINYDGSFRWRENGAAICSDGSHQDSPSIAIDNETNIWAVWTDYRFAAGERRRDLYFQKFSSRATDSFRVISLLDGWDGIPLCSENFDQTKPQIVHDARNGMWIVWEDSRSNNIWSLYTDIYATHLNSNGVPFDGWGENGQVVCDAYHRQESPQAVLLRNSGETGIVTSWIDKRCTSYEELFNLYTQRLDDDYVSVDHRHARNNPTGYTLDEPYPNPFNSQTMISYTAKSDGLVTIGLYDITGRLVRQLSSGKIVAGSHRLQVNAEDLATGQYIVRLEAGGVKLERKIVLIK